MSEPTDASADSLPGPRTASASPTAPSAPDPISHPLAPEPQMRYVDLTGSREAAGRSIRMLDMARRLPQLVRRSLALAWRVDRRATVGLLLCQTVTG